VNRTLEYSRVLCGNGSAVKMWVRSVFNQKLSSPAHDLLLFCAPFANSVEALRKNSVLFCTVPGLGGFILVSIPVL